jgi:hypothetical protein
MPLLSRLVGAISMAERTRVAKRVETYDEKASERNAMKRFSVICLQCGLSVDRLIDAETAQTEIHPVTYQQKCKPISIVLNWNAPSKGRDVGPDFPERHVSSYIQRRCHRVSRREDITEIVITTAAGILALSGPGPRRRSFHRA